MKRKYAAMVLGLTLALTSMNVAYAAEKDTTTAAEAAADTKDTETADTSTDETASDEVYGEVTEADYTGCRRKCNSSCSYEFRCTGES